MVLAALVLISLLEFLQLWKIRKHRIPSRNGCINTTDSVTKLPSSSLHSQVKRMNSFVIVHLNDTGTRHIGTVSVSSSVVNS